MRAAGRRQAVLLSGLVFPGLGQLATGRPWRGLFFGGSSVALLVAVVRRVILETERLLPTDAEALLDPALPFRLAAEIHRENASFFLWTTLGIVALWLGSMADAWSRPARGAGRPGPDRSSLLSAFPKAPRKAGPLARPSADGTARRRSYGRRS